MTRRIKVTGVKREDINYDDLAFVYYQMAKRRAQERRERKASERAKRQQGGKRER